MKKIFIAGIAAMLLATTTVDAQVAKKTTNTTQTNNEDELVDELIDAFAEDLQEMDKKAGYTVEENNKAWKAVISYIQKPLSKNDFGAKATPHPLLTDFFVGAPTWYKPSNLPKWDFYAEEEYLADFGNAQYYISLGKEGEAKYFEDYLSVKGMDLLLQGIKLDFTTQERNDIKGASLAYDLLFKSGQKLLYKIYVVPNANDEKKIRLITIIHK